MVNAVVVFITPHRSRTYIGSMIVMRLIFTEQSLNFRVLRESSGLRRRTSLSSEAVIGPEEIDFDTPAR